MNCYCSRVRQRNRPLVLIGTLDKEVTSGSMTSTTTLYLLFFYNCRTASDLGTRKITKCILLTNSELVPNRGNARKMRMPLVLLSCYCALSHTNKISNSWSFQVPGGLCRVNVADIKECIHICRKWDQCIATRSIDVP